MKHWSYIGLALIALNAFILKGARAAELNPGYSRPSSGFFRFPFMGFWATKPHPEVVSPVSVRLFAAQKLDAVLLRNRSGFLVSGIPLKAPVLISVQDRQLYVRSQGKKVLVASELDASAIDDMAFELKVLHGPPKWTRGELHVRISKGRILLINRLNIEDYVSGILEGELGSLKLSPEVLKAQIVVARTYVLSMRGDRHHGEGYEFCDRPHCQVFSGIPMNNPAYDKAISSVRGEYLSYHGGPIAAFYHHNCGGMTSAVEDVWPSPARPYLKAVREPEGSSCRTARGSQWSVSLSKKSLAVCFREAGWMKRHDTLEAIQITKKDPSGRAEEILILTRKPIQVTVGRFRNVINQYYGHELLKSALFIVTSGEESVAINGRGWGHGVGLCQVGAMWMARHGKTYKQILSNYFPHTQLKKLR